MDPLTAPVVGATALVIVVVSVGIVWTVLERQKRQIRTLMSRLEAVEQQTFDRVASISGTFDAGTVPAEDEGPDQGSDGDVLAGFTSHINRIVAGAGDGILGLADRAILQIHENLEESYRPAQLADDLYISLRTLERGLAEVFDCTPSQLITAMKMRMAKRMLESGHFRVNEVASRLGFSSPFYFSRRFRTYFGVAPSECRQAAGGV